MRKRKRGERNGQQNENESRVNAAVYGDCIRLCSWLAAAPAPPPQKDCKEVYTHRTSPLIRMVRLT